MAEKVSQTAFRRVQDIPRTFEEVNEAIEGIAGLDVGNLNSRVGVVESSLADNAQRLKTITLDLKKDFNVDSLNASTALQNAVNSAKTNAYTKIKAPVDTYYFDTPIMCTGDNLEIDFTGSKVKWKGTADLGVSNGANRDYGLLNFWGTRGAQLPTIVSFIPDITSVNNLNKFSVIGGIDFGQDMSGTLATNDFIEIDIDCGWSFTAINDYKPIARALCRVVGFSGNLVFIDYSSPFNWSNATLVTKTAYKCTPVKNVKVKGFDFEDTTAHFSGTPTNAQRQSWVAAISLQHTHNVIIEEFKSTKHKFPSIIANFVHTVSIRNGYASYPDLITGGCGYGIQINAGMFVNVENFFGVMNRHLVDFSASAFCNVTNCAQTISDPSLAPFDCHGIGEHHISFKNTVGTIYLGNGVTQFPLMTSEIKIDNHNGVVSLNYGERVRITNSDIFLYGWSGDAYWNSVAIENSKVKVHPDSYQGTTRSGNVSNPYFKFKNCEVTLENRSGINTYSYVTLTGYETFEFINCDVYDNVSSTTSQGMFILNGIKYIKIKGGNNQGVSFQQNGNLDDGVLRVQDVDFVMNKSGVAAPCFISIQPAASSGKFSLIYDKNTLINKNTGVCKWLRMGGTPSTYPNMNATIINNHFLLNVDDSVQDQPQFKWNTAGNFLDGYTPANSVILSKGLVMVASNKTIKRIGLDTNGNVVSTT